MIVGGVAIAAQAVDHAELDRRRAEEQARLQAEIDRAEAKLANQGFVAKAPPEVVQAERDKLAALRRQAGGALMGQPAKGAGRWTIADAERYLLGLELFGMRFGLDRMRRLLTALDQPQNEFPAIHVVGSNGKTSTTRMAAAILERHGLRTGAYLSPHLVSFTERLRVGDTDVSRRGLRRRRPARRPRGEPRRPHAGRRRPRHAVRGADRRGAFGAGQARGRGQPLSRPASAGASTRPTS